MNIQSLSIVVPNKKCINDCVFCCAKMHTECYVNQMNDNGAFFDLYEKDYIKRLEFARDNGCNTIMLTGNSEPQQNRPFLQHFASMNERIKSPFKWIEMQTTGVLLDKPYLRFLRNTVGVSTISLSINSFDDVINREIIGADPRIYNPIEQLCKDIKLYDFNLRLSINLNKNFGYSPEILFAQAKRLGADQITFRFLYEDGDNAQSKWVRENKWDKEAENNLISFVKEKGRPLEVLPFGKIKYSCFGMSTVLDDDCMSVSVSTDYKYLILRENCKLYSKWDDEASLIF